MISHLGRPKENGEQQPEFSLSPVVKRLEQLLNRSINRMILSLIHRYGITRRHYYVAAEIVSPATKQNHVFKHARSPNSRSHHNATHQSIRHFAVHLLGWRSVFPETRETVTLPSRVYLFAKHATDHKTHYNQHREYSHNRHNEIN